MKTYKKNLASWQKAFAQDQEMSQTLFSLQKNKENAEDAFYRDLAFGTAGMRGTMGYGTNRMNIYTVRRATMGFAKFIKAQQKEDSGIAIAYDSRNFSDIFAKEAALTLASFGVKVYLYSTMHSVPQLSFSVLHLKCAGGIAITASHNPSVYNGYKVYGEDGGQLGVAQAEALTAYIGQSQDYLTFTPITEQEALQSGLLIYIGAEIDRCYYENVLSLIKHKELVQTYGSALNIVYTPLFGTGKEPITHILHTLGVSPILVEEQACINGSFPGLKAPNPETTEAYEKAIVLANEHKADIILATDPDSDRLGVAVRNRIGAFTILSGNQVGCFLLHHIATTWDLQHTKAPFAVRSIVSTPMADSIAHKHNIEMRTVFTGFKNIAEQIENSLLADDSTFLFGFEESYGYLSGTFVRDKDACIAATLFTEAACKCLAAGQNLYDAILALHEEYGFYGESIVSLTLQGKVGAKKIASAVASFRQKPPTHIANNKIIAITDYLTQTITTLSTSEVSATNLPASDVITYHFEDGYATFRPSGTEPKIKAYISCKGTSFADMTILLDAIQKDVDALLLART